MPVAEKLVSAVLAGFLVAVVTLIIQLTSSTAVANYTDGSVQQSLNPVLPLLLGTLAGAGSFVLLWSGRSRRGKRRGSKPSKPMA